MYTRLTSLPRSAKRMLFFVADTLLVPVSLYLAFALRFADAAPRGHVAQSLILFPLVTVCGAGIVWVTRMDRMKLRVFDDSVVIRIAATAAGLGTAAILLIFFLRLDTPRSIPLMLGLIYFFGAVSSRIAAQLALRALRRGNAASVPVAVYGAGSAGIQLVTALRRSSEVNPVVFVDDNRSLWGMLVSGIKVERPARLAGLVASGRVGKVLIAMPSAPSERVSAIVAAIEPLGCEIQILPSYVDMISGAAIEQALIPVSHDALLGRDMVDLNTPEIEQSYAGRVVMVTGAGGSIGSELCRQLLECHPRRIVLFERSEFALYQVNEDLRESAKARRIGLSVRLGSVTDAARVAEVIAREGVEIILHAAAYKHVPIVEENEIEGARNNILGTKAVAKAAQAAGVERFILISTDKAVRPTSVMGATKRMAELVLQDMQTRPGTTIFSMVRFGNVLGSSGSVLPLFERQIRAGGPVTVTHPEVTRFFMTIPEASRLVLLAGTYARGGDVFVLDMGEPIRILDVARRMITLSGRKPVLDVLTSEDGAISICFTGLRPGEKLYEERLIDGDNLRETPHGKIMRAEEARLSRADMDAILGELRAILDRGDSEALRALLARRIPGFAVRREPKLASYAGPARPGVPAESSVAL